MPADRVGSINDPAFGKRYPCFGRSEFELVSCDFHTNPTKRSSFFGKLKLVHYFFIGYGTKIDAIGTRLPNLYLTNDWWYGILTYSLHRLVISWQLNGVCVALSIAFQPAFIPILVQSDFIDSKVLSNVSTTNLKIFT